MRSLMTREGAFAELQRDVLQAVLLDVVVKDTP